jgi:predicted aminopeptidase
MDVLRLASLVVATVIAGGTLTGCQISYYLKSGYNQMSMLSHRVPFEKALQDPTLSETDKKKIRLAQEAHEFAINDLHLKQTKSYTTFVKLDRDYVTYVVSASPKWELKHYLWSYPFVGSLPYKGYFNEKDAKAEADGMKSKDYDTYMRGVSAYSTLGYFDDPLLSSMLGYSDADLVNTVIHETVHTTLYIKSSADFNERLAVFLGGKGTEMFYLKKEGADSPTLLKIKAENDDDKLFSDFISGEIKSLEAWYKSQTVHDEAARQARLKLIQTNFTRELLPKLKTENHKAFAKVSLNNARLLVYKTYMQDLSDFQRLYDHVGQDFTKFIDACRSLEKSKHPEEDLKALASPPPPGTAPHS